MIHNCSNCEKKNEKNKDQALIQIEVNQVGCEGHSEIRIEGTGKLIYRGLVSLLDGLTKSAETKFMLMKALKEVELIDG